MLKGPASSCTPQNACQDLASLAKTDRSSSFRFMTLVNSMAGNKPFSFTAPLNMD